MAQLPMEDAVQRFKENEERIDVFVNESDTTDVTTRTGEKYPTLRKTVKQLFENGGLPATPFKTKALMTASALVDGDYAAVTDDDVEENIGIYIKQSGQWIKSKYSIPEIAERAIKRNFKEIAVNTENPFAVTDSLGQVALQVDKSGQTTVANLKAAYAGTSGVVMQSSPSGVLSVQDKDGNQAFHIDNSGMVYIGNLEVANLTYGGGVDLPPSDGGGGSPEVDYVPPKKVGTFDANVIHLEVYGQSLSQGAYSTPIQTTTQKYDSLMFTGGIRPEHPHNTSVPFYEDFIPLVEAASGDGYVGYETPVSGAAEAIKQLIKDENGISRTEQQYQILGTASGNGGLSLQTLSTTSFDEHLKPSITNAYSLCQQKGLTYAMPLMGWVQGEQDNKPGIGTGIDEYNTNLEALRVKIDNHLKTLNQSLSLDGFVVGQLCSFKTSGRAEPHIELAIYKASVKPDNNVYLACPFYIFDYKDGFHVDGVSSKVMGAYMGLVYKRVVVDRENWYPIYPISNTRQGRVLEVRFHVPAQPLVFDTDFITENTNYGFILVDASGVEITLTEVKITQPDTVRFTAFDDIPEGCKLRYAWTPAASPNRSTGPRGNMRDSQGDSLVFDPNGIKRALHNWTPIFEYEVI